MHGDYFFDYLTHVQNFFMRTARGSVSSPDQGKPRQYGPRLAPVLNTIFINVPLSYACRQSNSDGWLQSLKQFFIKVSLPYTCSQTYSDGSV